MSKKSQDKLQDLRKALNENCLERGDVIDGALVALLAREHILMIGTPGCGKSMLSRLCAQAIHGRYFETTGHPLMKPEELFGPISVQGMRNGTYERLIDGYLPTADIGFVDEGFKTSMSIRQTMLTIANERIYKNGKDLVKCPLRTMFVASNELPTNANDAAFYDRLALRYEVSQLQDDDNAIKLFTGLNATPVPELAQADLALFDKEVAQVKLSVDIAKVLLEIRREIANENIFVSDRKWFQVGKLLQAAAYLEGSSDIQPDHFDILNAVLWNTPDERAKSRKIVGKHGNPIGEKIMELQDAFADIGKDMNRADGDEKRIDETEAFSKMRATLKKFEALKKEHPNNAKVDRAYDICNATYQKLAKKVLNIKE